jgi:hypothetical protein
MAERERRYNLPTSAGKTLVSELLLLRSVLRTNGKALLVLPYRAVVDEVFAKLLAFGTALEIPVEAFYAARVRVRACVIAMMSACGRARCHCSKAQ